jgi:hypothetical protein
MTCLDVEDLADVDTDIEADCLVTEQEAKLAIFKSEDLMLVIKPMMMTLWKAVTWPCLWMGTRNMSCRMGGATRRLGPLGLPEVELPPCTITFKLHIVYFLLI